MLELIILVHLNIRKKNSITMLVFQMLPNFKFILKQKQSIYLIASPLYSSEVLSRNDLINVKLIINVYRVRIVVKSYELLLYIHLLAIITKRLKLIFSISLII